MTTGPPETDTFHIKLPGARSAYRIRLHGSTRGVGLASPRWCTDCPSVNVLSSEALGACWLPVGLEGTSWAISSILFLPNKTAPDIL